MKHLVRWVAIGVGLVIVALGVVLAVQHRKEASVPALVQEHGPLPNFKVATLDGKPLDSASLKGKTVVVNFFNSWCIPCRQEAGDLQAFYAAHKNERDLAMIGIVRDDEKDAVRSYVNEHKVAWPVAMDPQGSAALGFGTTGQPETYVISPDGVAVCGALGPSTEAELETWVAAARNGQECT